VIYTHKSQFSYLEFNIFKTCPGLLVAFATKNSVAASSTLFPLSFRTEGTGASEATCQAQRLFCERLGFDPALLLQPEQKHGAEVAWIGRGDVEKFIQGGPIVPGVDALITNARKVPLMARAADCPLVVLYDFHTRQLAVAHSGWRGTLDGIVERTVKEMERRGAHPADMVAGVTPSIGPCCFEVGEDVVAKAQQTYPDCPDAIIQKDTRSYLDLRTLIRATLVRAGVSPHRIEISTICSACNAHFFFSHRKEGPETGRNAVLAGLLTYEHSDSDFFLGPL